MDVSNCSDSWWDYRSPPTETCRAAAFSHNPSLRLIHTHADTFRSSNTSDFLSVAFRSSCRSDAVHWFMSLKLHKQQQATQHEVWRTLIYTEFPLMANFKWLQQTSHVCGWIIKLINIYQSPPQVTYSLFRIKEKVSSPQMSQPRGSTDD